MNKHVDHRENSIPVIDLEPLISGLSGGLETVADQIRLAYERVGFAYIIHHGVSPDLIHQAFSMHRQFHALSLEEKTAITVNRWHRGYIAINTSTIVTTRLARVTRPNQSESFMMMHELATDDPDVLSGKPLAGPNQIPASQPEFEETLRAYNQALQTLCETLRPAFSTALGGLPEAMDRYFTKPTTFLRLLHYPPISGARPDDLYGSAPHTDYGFITVLAQDDAGGLHVRTPEGVWIDAPPRPGAFILNTGDITARWSNGRFLSTPHRVYNRQDRDRYSMAFFYDPGMDVEVSCLPFCLEPGQRPLCDPVVYGDYLMEKLNAHHDYRKKKGDQA